MEQIPSGTSPHVLIFPFPGQGFVNPMLKLAELLALSGLNISFINSNNNHERLLQHTDIQDRFSRYPGFQFKTIWDGLPTGHPRSGGRFTEMFDSVKSVTMTIFKEMLIGMRPKVNFMIGDGLMGYLIDIANEFNIPIIHFRTISACCFWAFFSLPHVIEDGQLPIKDHISTGSLTDVFESSKLNGKSILKQMLIEISPPINCIIRDGILGFVLDVAIELAIPIIHFRTISASCLWVYFSIPYMIEAGELAIQGEEDMDRLITKVPGMETFLRCRDLPSFCRVSDIEDRNLNMIIKETRQSPRAQALIINTFEDLEGPILSQIRNHCPKTYTIGPLHELLKTKLRNINAQELYQSSNSLWEVDRKCITWLDGQPPQSVLYVSFGSITVTTKDELMEFWHGIVNSKKRFLWVIRPNSIPNKEDGDVEKIPEEFEEGCKENGYIVKWAPQEEVLGHKAIGGFLTHNGWNSTLESIVAGVPMICWPYFADQQVNSRFVSEVWKLGLDMKDVCNREIIEKMVNDLMVDRREEFVRSTARMAELARKSVSEGGSSYCNLNRLIEDIRLMSVQAHDQN